MVVIVVQGGGGREAIERMIIVLLVDGGTRLLLLLVMMCRRVEIRGKGIGEHTRRPSIIDAPQPSMTTTRRPRLSRNNNRSGTPIVCKGPEGELEMLETRLEPRDAILEVK